MKVLYTSDLHGETHLYRQVLELAYDSSAEIIALGGDLLPSLRGGRYEDMAKEQISFMGEFLLPFFERCLKAAHAKHILIIPGNWDIAYPDLFAEPATRQSRDKKKSPPSSPPPSRGRDRVGGKFFSQEIKRLDVGSIEGVIDLERKKFQVNGYDWIGYPFVPPTPFRPKDYEKMDAPELPWPPQKNPSYIRSADQTHSVTPIDPHFFLKQRGTIREDLDQLAKPNDYRKAIYIMHSPPYGTRLDLVSGGQSVGSRSIRHFIEAHQPLLTLHGHIHESPELSGNYYDRIGKTLSVNPGQSFRKDRDFLRIQAIIFEMENPGDTLIHTCFQ